MEKEYADQDSPYRTYASPYGVSGAYWQTLRGLGQQSHTDDCENKESGNPSPPREAVNGFCPSEAIGETDLA